MSKFILKSKIWHVTLQNGLFVKVCSDRNNYVMKSYPRPGPPQNNQTSVKALRGCSDVLLTPYIISGVLYQPLILTVRYPFLFKKMGLTCFCGARPNDGTVHNYWCLMSTVALEFGPPCGHSFPFWKIWVRPLQGASPVGFNLFRCNQNKGWHCTQLVVSAVSPPA